MPLIEWNEKLSVGVRQFDDDHQKLVLLLNGLFEDSLSGHAKEVIGIVLDELIHYARSHFAAEESLMREYGYPKLEAHEAEHRALIIRVLELREDYLAGANVSINLDLATFLKNWLVDHILGADRDYGRYLAPRGVS